MNRPGFFPAPREHGADAYAEHALDVCPTCQQRINQGAEVRWDTRATTRGGGFSVAQKGRWVHWTCFDRTAWKPTRR